MSRSLGLGLLFSVVGLFGLALHVVVVQVFLRHGGGSLGHEVATLLGLGEGNDVADRRGTHQDGKQAVQACSTTAKV